MATATLDYAAPRDVAAAQPATSPAAAPKVKVLHLINGEHYAGAERVQDLLAQRLPEFGYEVSFVCVKPARFATSRHCQSVPVYNIAMRSKYDLGVAGRIAQLVRREGFQIIHTHTPRTAMIGRLVSLLTGVEMVHHVHGQTSTEVERSFKNKLKSKFNAVIERLSLAGAKKVIAVSETSRNYMTREGLAANRLAVVPNGIAVAASARHAAQHDTFTLGIVGLLRPRKGLEVLLAAVAQLRQQGINAQLRAVGTFETPEYEAEVHQLVARLGLEEAVEWRGFQRDVNAELAAMDLFVFPSILAEGMPMVVLEAMSAGVPIVASRVDGVTDVLREGEDALFVRPGDAADLAEKIAAVIGGQIDVQPLSQSAQARQAERFSDTSMAQGVAEIYETVLSA